MFLSKKSQSVVIAISLLLIVTVVSVGGFNIWFKNYSSKTYNDIRNSNINLEITYLDSNYLYINNLENINITFNNILVDNKDCSQNGSLSPNLNKIDISMCLNGLSSGIKKISLLTDSKIITKSFYYKYGSSESPFLISYSTSNGCQKGIEIFGHDNLGEHLSLNSSDSAYSSFYSVCVYHTNFILGNNCFGNYTRLFYLENVTESHIYTNNSNPYPGGTYNWQEICLSVIGTNVTSTVQSTSPGNGYYCLGSVESGVVDNTYGSHFGSCKLYSGNQDKIWVKFG